MSEQQAQSNYPTFTTAQYGLYVLVAFVIWVSGVVIVRVLGPNFFELDSGLLLLLFVVSIPFGIVIQFLAPFITRLPMKDTLIPVSVMVGAALMMDGIAITFTDVYSSDVGMKMAVGGWLLWTFGSQVIISLIMIGRANQA